MIDICNYWDGKTGSYCTLPRGHEGDHRGLMRLTWPREGCDDAPAAAADAAEAILRAVAGQLLRHIAAWEMRSCTVADQRDREQLCRELRALARPAKGGGGR